MLRVGGRAGDGGLPAGHGEPDVSTPPQCETFSRWGTWSYKVGTGQDVWVGTTKGGKEVP